MGIYDENKGLRFPDLNVTVSAKPLKIAGIAIVAIIVIAGLFLVAQALLKPDPLKLSFSENPLDLAKEHSSMLTVRVSNVLEGKAENVLVKVVPDDPALLVYPKERIIEVLGQNAAKEVTFTVRPDPRAKILQGAYKIKVHAVLGGEEFEKEATLFIKTAQ